MRFLVIVAVFVVSAIANADTKIVVKSVTVGPNGSIVLTVEGPDDSIQSLEDSSYTKIYFDGQNITKHIAKKTNDGKDSLEFTGEFHRALYSEQPDLKFLYRDGEDDKEIDIGKNIPNYKESLQSDKWVHVREPSIDDMKIEEINGQIHVYVKATTKDPKDKIKSLSCYSELGDDDNPKWHPLFETPFNRTSPDGFQDCKEDGTCEYIAPRMATASGEYGVGCRVSTQWLAGATETRKTKVKAIDPEAFGYKLKRWSIDCESWGPRLKIETVGKNTEVRGYSLHGVRSSFGDWAEDHLPGVKYKHWESGAEQRIDDGKCTGWAKVSKATDPIEMPIITESHDVSFFPSHFYLTTTLCNGKTWTTDLADDKYLYGQLKACSKQLIQKDKEDTEEEKNRAQSHAPSSPTSHVTINKITVEQGPSSNDNAVPANTTEKR